VDKLLGAMTKFNADQGLFVAWGGFKGQRTEGNGFTVLPAACGRKRKYSTSSSNMSASTKTSRQNCP
jgi:hypothetical protein